MKLWMLEPIEGAEYWNPWYDKCFANIVRAESEADARELAAAYAGDEGKNVWIDNTATTCIELTADGDAEHIMRDFASA